MVARAVQAATTYEAGLAVCPDDATLVAALKEVKEVKERAESAGSNPFGNIMGKLAGHPKFGEWIADPVGDARAGGRARWRRRRRRGWGCRRPLVAGR